MFENYTKSEQTKAKQDFKACKAVFDALRAAGKADNEIKDILSAMLAGKAWRDEIINELFDPYKSYREREKRQKSQWERKQREYQRNYNDWHYNHQQSSNYNQHSLTEALQFFGFTAMPASDELKKRYRELCMKNHPDKGGSTAIFQKLQDYKDQLYARAGL